MLNKYSIKKKNRDQIRNAITAEPRVISKFKDDNTRKQIKAIETLFYINILPFVTIMKVFVLGSAVICSATVNPIKERGGAVHAHHSLLGLEVGATGVAELGSKSEQSPLCSR